MRLDEAPIGSRLHVTGATLDARAARLLATLGVTPGAHIELVQRTAFGGRVVAIGADRVALDNGTCRNVIVDAP